MKHSNAKAIWSALLVVAGLYGCSTTPPARLYVIEPLATDTEFELDQDLTVVVGPVTLPERLNRREILSHGERYRVSTAEFDRWAEPLDENIARAVVGNLSVLSRTGSFLPYPSSLSGAGGYSVRIVVHEFGDAPDGTVILRASWALIATQSALPVFSEVRLSEQRNDSEVITMVAAMSRLVEKLSREIAAALAKSTLSANAGDAAPG